MKNLSLILAIFFASSFAIMAQLNNNPNSGNGGLRDNSNTGRGGEHRPGSHDNHGNNNNGNGNWNNNNNNNNNNNGNWTNHNGHHHDNGNGSWNGNNNNGHHHGNGHNHGHNHGNGNWNNNNGHNHNGHHHYNSYCSYGSHGFNWVAVHIDIFNSNCHNIRNYGFDSDRLQAAKYFANNNHLSVAQVCDLMNMLSFESSRLEFAKFAFARTCDIQNYHLVFNYLSFNSSRRDLDFYISTFRF